MSVRTSYVRDLQVESVTFSSVLKVGDTQQLKPQARVFALQRQAATFWGNEGDLAQFPIFRQKIPLPPVRKDIFMSNEHHADIYVDRVKIVGLSSSAIVHIGTAKNVETEARVKHIRHFIVRDNCSAEH